jgi:hypothetical protein
MLIEGHTTVVTSKLDLPNYADGWHATTALRCVVPAKEEIMITHSYPQIYFPTNVFRKESKKRRPA